MLYVMCGAQFWREVKNIKDETNTQVQGHRQIANKTRVYFPFWVLGAFHINPPLAICNNISHNARLVFTFYVVWSHVQSKTKTVFHFPTLGLNSISLLFLLINFTVHSKNIFYSKTISGIYIDTTFILKSKQKSHQSTLNL